MKPALTLALTALVSLPALAERAHYFRAWQGFKRPDLSASAFLQTLTPFMGHTVDLYRDRALSNYLVIIPPAVKPAFVPDEFALVALSSREDYQAIRATPAGQAYGAAHWDLFDQATSKSADPMVNFTAERPSQLQHNVSYDVIGTPIDWSQGHNLVYIGVRKAGVSRALFLRRLAAHLDLTKRANSPQGLRGYIVIANQDYEVAFLNWSSKRAFEASRSNPRSLAASADAAELMELLMLAPAQTFRAGQRVAPGSAYSTISGR